MDKLKMLLAKLNRLFLLIIIIAYPAYATASVCTNLAGNWQGEWQDERHNVMPARLWFNIDVKDQFTGGFTLQDGSTGKLNGSCNSLNNNEAYVMLAPDAPSYNPCRGTLLVDKDKMATHFFCFNPNQSGYFIK